MKMWIGWAVVRLVKTAPDSEVAGKVGSPEPLGSPEPKRSSEPLGSPEPMEPPGLAAPSEPMVSLASWRGCTHRAATPLIATCWVFGFSPSRRQTSEASSQVSRCIVVEDRLDAAPPPALV